MGAIAPPPPQAKEIDSPAMLWIQIRVRGSGGYASPVIVYKNGAIWCILSVLKDVIMNLKINSFKGKFSQ